MNKETELRIEKEAETRYFSLDEVLAYKCGAESEHPKAWNAAIDAAIEKINERGEAVDPIFQLGFYAIMAEFKALKLDPNQA